MLEGTVLHQVCIQIEDLIPNPVTGSPYEALNQMLCLGPSASPFKYKIMAFLLFLKQF